MNQDQINTLRAQPVSPQHHLIEGKAVPASDGQTMAVISPIDGSVLTTIARGTAADMDDAIRSARAAFEDGRWASQPPAARKKVLLKWADLIEAHALELAVLGVRDNGTEIAMALKAEPGSAAATIRYYAEALDKVYGEIAPTQSDILGMIHKEAVGVVGAIIPWNFPLLMAAWKVAPALAAGNCVVLKPAEQTPATIMVFCELIADILPAGVLNVVNGFGLEAGKPLAQSNRIAKVAFTGETTTGRLIMQYATENIIPVTLELGGKSPNIFHKDILDEDDAFFDKCLEGAAMFALNQGEVCTCPSRAIIHESIYDRFMERVIARTEAVNCGDPREGDTMMGAQASSEQQEKILSYLDIGRQEGANVATGGSARSMPGDMANGYYIEPTILEGNNKMRVFQEEIFGPVVSVTKFSDDDEALSIANDTLYGLGAGVWTRDGNKAYRFGRAIKAGRVWTNCYHLYPAHAPFGGYKKSGIGRETHKMMLNHYRQTKNMLINYSKDKLGFF